MTNAGSGDPGPQLIDYYPAWLDNLADDVTLEGSAMDGFVQGAEAVRAVLVSIRALYDYQEFSFAGPYGENGWLEDYTAGVRGEPIGNITLVTRNAAGQAQHIVGNYRPRSTMLLLSRLIGEQPRRHPLRGALPRQRAVSGHTHDREYHCIRRPGSALCARWRRCATASHGRPLQRP